MYNHGIYSHGIYSLVAGVALRILVALWALLAVLLMLRTGDTKELKLNARATQRNSTPLSFLMGSLTKILNCMDWRSYGAAQLDRI
jgi:hypothetical protein